MSGGIACAGTFIVDRVKVVDRYPSESTVAMILDEKESNGGCAFNVLLNLARIDPELPLFAVGMIGDDLDAQKVMSMCSRYPGIDLTGLVRTRRASTSYTDVISARSNGSRTFFHRSGANALFSPEAVDLERLEVSLLHLGYLLVLDAMDAPDAKYGRVSARFLHDVQARGVRTSIDLVSAENADFPGIVNPALAFTDYCIVNEFEAQQLTEIRLQRSGRIDVNAVAKAARVLLDRGVHELAVIHFPEGAVALSANGTELLQPSLAVPAEQIVGATGAGDAFCAGVLYGCYQGWSLEQTMLLGACAGAQCLRGLAASDAIGAWQTALALVDRYGFRGELG
jgi:sugar/nucleoside kinase (ribokinase family)